MRVWQIIHPSRALLSIRANFLYFNAPTYSVNVATCSITKGLPWGIGARLAFLFCKIRVKYCMSYTHCPTPIVLTPICSLTKKWTVKNVVTNYHTWCAKKSPLYFCAKINGHFAVSSVVFWTMVNWSEEWYSVLMILDICAHCVCRVVNDRGLPGPLWRVIVRIKRSDIVMSHVINC